MSAPLLSIGMIFKNDIRCIERCLKSLEPLRRAIPSELIMADTGSTDGSRAVAERYADQVIDFPWVNDFSAARNAVLDRCSGEWYVTVDTDEWLDPECQELVRFLKSEQRMQYDLGSLIQRNYRDKDLREYGDFFAMRLGRRCGGELRYQDPIHEYLSYPNRPAHGCKPFPHMILHHDGYVEVEKGHRKEKQRRNMELLQRELEKRPEDLRTLSHCMDAAQTREEKRAYADRALEVLHKEQQKRREERMIFDVIAYQRCMQIYYGEQEMERVLECYRGWKDYYPESALLKVDGEAIAAMAEYKKGNYEETLQHIERRLQGLEDKDKGTDIQQKDRLYGQYNTDARHWNSRLYVIRFQSVCSLKQFEEADELLRQLPIKELLSKDVCQMAKTALEEVENLPDTADFLCHCWDFYQDDAQWIDKEEAAQRQSEWNGFARLLQTHLEKAGRAGEELLAQMGNRAPGQSARICLTDDPRQVMDQWAEVKEWKWVLPQAYRHTMDMRLPMPDELHRQNAEQLRGVVSALAAQPGFFRTVLDWIIHTPAAQTTGELNWQLDLVAAALRTPKWREDVPVGEGLCALYLDLSAAYLENVYNPQLLNREDISILPGMHRYGWHCRQAFAALEQGDELGYVRELRAGLDTAPAMKDMVDFLLEHKPKTAAQKELEQLAGQVREVLSQYAPSHPAVVALKASPVYQKVAYLLEADQPPRKPEAPVSPKLLEEALTGTPEEVEKSIRESIDRWGEKAAEKRMEYWRKYPLWGKDKDEVVNNLTTALCVHGKDFRWLFDRLADEQSRRILTAVVRSWRFFDILLLQQEEDAVYDDYFDLELLRCDDNEVVADLGAFIGDTFLSYIKNYGSMAYGRYYCYEITQESVDRLARNTADYPRVVIRRKGAGAALGTMTLHTGVDASANGLAGAPNAEKAETVEIVALDQDIPEPLTLIKMDIEGAEQSALQGCVRHIREDRPKLALSVYHNFEDLWKLPQMIEALVPGYRFYLRYHGGDLWPSEITLLAIPPER